MTNMYIFYLTLAILVLALVLVALPTLLEKRDKKK